MYKNLKIFCRDIFFVGIIMVVFGVLALNLITSYSYTDYANNTLWVGVIVSVLFVILYLVFSVLEAIKKKPKNNELNNS